MSSTTAPAKQAADVAEIRQALDLLAVQGGVAEIRALKIPGRGKPFTAAGYFLDRDKAAQAAATLDRRQAAGVYLVLNEIDPALLARSPEQTTDHLDQTTSDGDIIRRRWLPLDFDPQRASGISSTDQEHQAAEAVARECADWLREDAGWPEPVIADSGNGCHLLYRVDIPNDDAARGLVQGVIAAIAERFNGRGVDVDRSVFNAARIWKLYGTTARKGHDMRDRPHRVARLVDVPEPVQVVPVGKLQAVAAIVSKPEPTKPSTNGNGRHTSRLDVPRWLTDKGVTFKTKDRPDRLGRAVYILDTCPFDSGHGGNGEVAVMQGPDGQLAASCKHNSCTGRGWQQFKEAIGTPESDHYNPPLDNHQANGQAVHLVKPAGEVKPTEAPAFTKLLTGGELLALDLKPRFIVRGVLVEGQPAIIGGRSKTLKTSLACDLAISLGSGRPFLGRFDSQQVPVGIWIGESGTATTRETAKRQAAAKGVDLADCSVWWSFDLPKLCHLDHLDHLRATIKRHGLKVAIIDPLYLSLLNAQTAGQAANLFAMGAALQPLSKLAQEAGVTLIVLHHFRKGGQPNEDEPAGLEELTMSGAAEWSRQWILLQRRAAYQGDGRHLLWMRCGGSAGHSSLWGVTIDEGQLDPDTFTGRTWDVTVAPVADARAEAKAEQDNRKAAEQEKREGEQRGRLLTVLRTIPEGDTERALSRAARLNPDNFYRAITALLQEGRAARCKVDKNGVTYDGFQPTGK